MQFLKFTFCLLFFVASNVYSQNHETSNKIYTIIDSISSQQIENDITILANFGTRNTFSDTTSTTRGIGAARRFIKQEFEQISKECGGCLQVFEIKNLVKASEYARVPKDAWVVNIVAVQKGKTHGNNYVIMSGDIDSRASDGSDFITDAPGANDNATGMAGTIEAARVLSQYQFNNSIVYLGLSGEEQGLFGGQAVADYAKEQKWNIIGVLNNDMIGNIQGVDGVIDNRSFRIFSEPTPVTETDQQRKMRRYYGGEVDGVSRQLARYIHNTTQSFMPEMNPMLIYRLDRFGRGGHHKPFNDLGFAGVRIMEAHENYNQQHQDIRTANGIEYGDVLEHVNFDYAEKLTAVNAINLALLAWAPTAPEKVKIGGAVQADTFLAWEPVNHSNLKGYKVYWRDTTSPTWQHSRYVGKVNQFTLKGIVIDNYLFGVAAVGKDGSESLITFPSEVLR